MTRYFFVVLLMGLVGIAIVVKGAMIMFAERQYWHDVADRFVKENVTVKPNRGNILSSDGKLMASSLPEYKIYMDFMSGERDEKRRKKDQQRKDIPTYHPAQGFYLESQFRFHLYRASSDFSGHQCRHLQKPSAQGAGDEEPELQHSSQPQPAHLLHSV